MAAGTVPMYDTQGTLRDVPFADVKDVVAHGGVAAHPVEGPDGKTRMIPVTLLNDAAAHGGKILPLAPEEAHLPAAYGFTLANMTSNAWEGAKGVATGTYALGKDLVQNPNWFEGEDSTANKFVFKPADAEMAKAKELWNQGNHIEAMGHGLAAVTPLVGPAAAQLGEQAGSGDVGGAIAKAGGQVVAGAAIAKGTNAAVKTPGAAIDLIRNPDVIEAAKAGLKKLPVAAVRRIPYVGDVAADVYKAAQQARQAKAAAAAAPQPAAAPPVATPPAATPPAATPPAAPPAAVVPPPAAVAAPVAAPPAAVTPPTAAPAPAPAITPARIESLLNDATGGAPLEKNVPLKDQLKASIAKQNAKPLPEGFTPVKSSVLKGYKYDPATQEIEAITNSGSRYRTGEVSADQFAQFEAADSKGAAWNKLRGNATPLGKYVGDKFVPYQRAGLRSASPDTPAAAAQPKTLADLASPKVNSATVAAKPSLVPVERYSEPGNENGYFYAPTGEATQEFGNVLTKAHVDESALYKGTSSIDLAREAGYMDKPLKPSVVKKVQAAVKDVPAEWVKQYDLPSEVKTLADLEQYHGFINGNEFYEAFQRAAADHLKAKGFKGAYWAEEDELNPRQYQVWDRSAVHEPKTLADLDTSKPVAGEVITPKNQLEQIKQELRGQYPGNTEAQIEKAAKEQLAFNNKAEQRDAENVHNKIFPKAKPAAAAAPAGDLMSLLKQSVENATANKGKKLSDLAGTVTKYSPTKLADRWGVDEESLAAGREQTRGMRSDETEASIQALADRYKKGEAVDPVVEYRDADNNITSVDGRGRVIAAKRAGLKKIPLRIVRATASGKKQ